MKHFTYANVASTLALFIAVSGGGVAVAAVVANNSVGSPQIINGSVKAADLKTGAMSSPQVKNESLTGTDIKNGTLTRADLTDQKMGLFLAYARVESSDPLGSPTVLSGYYGYNSGGGGATSTRTAVGKYTVTFNGLQVPGAMPFASSFFDTRKCAPVGWNDVGVLNVDCRDNNGELANSAFLAAFLN